MVHPRGKPSVKKLCVMLGVRIPWLLSQSKDYSWGCRLRNW